MTRTMQTFMFATMLFATACAVAPEDQSPDERGLAGDVPAQADDSDPAQDPPSSEASAEITPLAASSSAIVNTNGTRAAEAFFNRGAPPFFDLFDAKCDAHQVYVLYRINNGSWTRRSNGGGCGTTLRIPLPNSGFNIEYKACVDVQFASDPCSGSVFDHN